MKTSRDPWALFVLSLSSFVAASPVATPVEANDFIRVKGLRLYDSKGAPHYLTGINYWACMNLAAGADQGGNYQRVVTELDQLQAAGVNHLRIMASSEGNPTQQPFRMNPPLMQAPGQWNEAIFVGLDICLAEMAKRGMRATMTLADQWQWSGGFAQYVSWANGNEAISYPPSWDLNAAPHPWGSYTTTGDWNKFITYGEAFYTNKQAETWYLAHIDKVLNRVNTINGRVYKNDATVMTWELANEPQPAVPTTFLGPHGLELPPNPSDPLLAWVDRISTYIKTNAPNQLVTAGFEGKQGEWYFKQVHSAKNIDYATTHCWVQNWGVYQMNDASAANLQNALDFATNFMAQTSQWAADIGKPVFVEEFGMARDNWLNNVAAGEYQYASKATTTHRDAYFTHVIGLAMQHFKDPAGSYVGTSPWAYGGIYRPETQKINKFGMVWAGDPPHEAPGWYDVYDTDNALKIILSQTQTVTKFLKK